MKGLKITLLLTNLLVLLIPKVISIEKDPTLDSINMVCRNKDSKFVYYKKIGMNQFAKNYLEICLNKEMQKAWEDKYKKCLKNNNDKYCYRNTKINPK